MRIVVNQNSKTPYFRQIKNQLKTMILKGEIADGALLPSERSMAELCGVHRNTVVKAYNELKADGLLFSSQGKGYTVLYPQQEHLLFGEDPDKKQGKQTVHWSALIRDAVQDMDTTFDVLFSKSYQSNLISFAGGIASPDLYSEGELAQVASGVIASPKQELPGEDIYTYTPYQGLPELRKQLALFLKGKGINAHPRQIQVISDANQAIDFIQELFLSPGDAVLVEEPMSPDLYREFTLKGARVIPISTDENGMLVETVEPLFQRYKPKLVYVNSSFHDPTGVNTSLERRKAFLKLSYRYHIPIIEDDTASELFYEKENLTSYKALDTGNSVLYIYSFALTFAPGMRIACVVAPKIVIESMDKMIALRIISFDSLSQRVMCEYMKQGIYRENAKKIRRNYREKRDLMYRLLEPARAWGAEFILPQGGVYLWVKLPACMKEENLRIDAEKQGVIYMPGFLFFPFGTGGEQYIRLNYSYPTKEEINQGIPILLESMQRCMLHS